MLKLSVYGCPLLNVVGRFLGSLCYLCCI